MKKTAVDKKKCPSKTFNYPKDSHARFCERCRKHNGRCPITGNKPTKTCTL